MWLLKEEGTQGVGALKARRGVEGVERGFSIEVGCCSCIFFWVVVIMYYVFFYTCAEGSGSCRRTLIARYGECSIIGGLLNRYP